MRSPGVLESHEPIVRALLDSFSMSTGKRISLVLRNGLETTAIHSTLGEEREYCDLVKEIAGESECLSNQGCRAAKLASATASGVMQCHAGLYNAGLKVDASPETAMVLWFGEFVLEGSEGEAEAGAKLHSFCEKHDVDAATRERLERALRLVPRETSEEMERLGETLAPAIEGLSKALHVHAQRIQTADVTHVLQIRLQAVLALAENLLNGYRHMTKHRIGVALNEILHAVVATVTVGALVGEYNRDYRFTYAELRSLVRKAARLYRAEAGRRGIRIKLHLDTRSRHGIPIEASIRHMEMALTNLVQNAVKYSFHTIPESARVVRIRGRSVGLRYRLEIENYGVGILPEEIASGKVFEDGYQGELTKGEYRTGAGLGLGFVKRVIEAHKGQILISSKPVAEGKVHPGMPHLTTVRVYIPYRQEGDRHGRNDRVDGG